jgi:transcriptional regulator with XRE-family HTH domain
MDDDVVQIIKEMGVTSKIIRLSKNISAHKFSLRIGKSESYIYKVENAKIIISFHTLFKICNQLQIHPAELFG